MQSNFLLGKLTMTEPARMALKRHPYDLVCRHAINDHGEISKDEQTMNDIGMKTLGPIMSRYKSDPTDPHSPNVIIFTKDTWSETLIALETDPVR